MALLNVNYSSSYAPLEWGHCVIIVHTRQRAVAIAEGAFAECAPYSSRQVRDARTAAARYYMGCVSQQAGTQGVMGIWSGAPDKRCPPHSLHSRGPLVASAVFLAGGQAGACYACSDAVNGPQDPIAGQIGPTPINLGAPAALSLSPSLSLCLPAGIY